MLRPFNPPARPARHFFPSPENSFAALISCVVYNFASQSAPLFLFWGGRTSGVQHPAEGNFNFLFLGEVAAAYHLSLCFSTFPVKKETRPEAVRLTHTQPLYPVIYFARRFRSGNRKIKMKSKNRNDVKDGRLWSNQTERNESSTICVSSSLMPSLNGVTAGQEKGPSINSSRLSNDSNPTNGGVGVSNKTIVHN